MFADIGPARIEVTRDTDSFCEPQIVRKRPRDFSDQ